MSHGKEEVGSLQENKIGFKSVELSPTKSVPKQSSASSVVRETQAKLAGSVAQQDTLKFEDREGIYTHRTSKQEGVSSNQGDSLDKDDGYLSSSRQTSTRYSSSCTDDNRPTVDIIPTHEKIQGTRLIIAS